MPAKSIFYQSPFLYICGLKYIHKSHFSERYRYIASFAKGNDTVLEPACGPAILADYLSPTSSYCGFDTNSRFIRYAQKKGINAFVGNALNQNNYQQSDVVVACDILHHLKPADRKTFIQFCFNAAKKYLIICEPAEDRAENGLKKMVNDFLFAFVERDGVNQPQRKECYTKKQLLAEAGHGFGTINAGINRQMKEIGEDLIIAYQKT